MEKSYVAFLGTRKIGQGTVGDVVAGLHARGEEGSRALVFEEREGVQLDFDLRGSLEEVLSRLEEHKGLTVVDTKPKGPGRPRLGVACREVCLLPDQWEWLGRQRGGASIALRRLVMEAMRNEWDLWEVRRNGVDRVLGALAGNLPGYEDVSRALWSGDKEGVRERIATWPEDLGAWVRGRLGLGADAL